jgi:hypothetical protein
LSRLAVDRVRRAGIRLEPLLSRAGLTIDQVDDPERRIDAINQIPFLAIALRHGMFWHAWRCLSARLPVQPHHQSSYRGSIPGSARAHAPPELFGHPASCRSAPGRILHPRIGPRFSPAKRSAPSAQARRHDACSVGRNF